MDEALRGILNRESRTRTIGSSLLRMADQLYLSYLLRGFSSQTMLRQFDKLLRAFPFSRLAKESALLRIQAIEYAEPPLLEQVLPQPVDPEAVIESCREFENPDCAYRVEASWDLWRFESDWEVAPVRAALCCFGPGFADGGGDQLRVEFGLDSQFLPQDGTAKTLYMVRSNIRSLLHFVHDADDALAADSRRLWSESGENFAERLQNALEEAG